MLRLVVDRKEKIITADGKHFTVFRTLVWKEDGEFARLQDIEDFTSVEDVEIFFVPKTSKLSVRKLDLSTEIQGGIARFLHRYHARGIETFDCRAFVNLVYVRCKRNDGEPLSAYWKKRPYTSRRKIGDVVFLAGEKEGLTYHIRHAAIYIGIGLYLSVYGGGGDLEIATLRDMKKGYNARYVLLGALRH